MVPHGYDHHFWWPIPSWSEGRRLDSFWNCWPFPVVRWQLDVLLKPVIQFEVGSASTEHVLAVVSCIVECLKLAGRPGEGPPIMLPSKARARALESTVLLY